MQLGYALKTSIEMNLRQVFSDTIDQPEPQAVIRVLYETKEGHEAASKGIPHTIVEETLVIKPYSTDSRIIDETKPYEKRVPIEDMISFERFELRDVLAERKKKATRRVKVA